MRKIPCFHTIISGCCAAWLKKLIAIIVLFALLGTNCSRFYIYAGFKLNRDYIAKNLCENKSRPWLHCNGKCYFMKKIRQAADNEKKQTDKDNLTRAEIILIQPVQTTGLQPLSFSDEIRSIIPYYGYAYDNQFLTAIFKPPKFIA